MSDYQAILKVIGELLDLPNVNVVGMEQQANTVIRLRVLRGTKVVKLRSNEQLKTILV